MSELRLVPITLRVAQDFVDQHHRHHKAPAGHKFSIGLEKDGQLVGVAIAGRPVARAYDNGTTLEVTRSCVLDDIPNGNSMLYGAVRRAAKAMGYKRVITYTQDGESGASLRGAGWKNIANRPARKGWSCQARQREDRGTDGIDRMLWEVEA